MFRGGKIYSWLLAVSVMLSIKASASIILPKIIGSNMVLQRDKPVPIWGRADAGESITVMFGSQVKRTKTNAAGEWVITLNAMPASAKPAQMMLIGKDTVTLHNILIGEVWLCSGQSNMEYTMTKSSKYANAIKSKGLDPEALAKEKNSNIRLFLVKRDLNKPGDINKGWNEAKDESLKAFSAAGYFFAKNLYQSLGIPVGVISSAIPGSAIEPWMSGSPSFQKEANELQMNLDETTPGKFYLTMIRPLAPFAIKGFLWYQGETNCFQKETREYTSKMEHLITSWRTLWKAQNLPFYYVQIAPFYYSKSKGKVILTEETLPEFWEAQAAALEIKNTGMVVITDLVDKLDDIHPTYKWEVGRRLALLALNKTYGKNIVSTGPVYKEMNVKESAIELSFDGVGSGLVSSDGKPLSDFLIGGKDGIFVPAHAVIKGAKVIVSAPSVPAPVHVRFAWNEAAQANFYNKEGLPAVPFRTDKGSSSKLVHSAKGPGKKAAAK